MEATYGIGVHNRYAVFLDEETDPLEFLIKKEQEIKEKKKKKTTNVSESDSKEKTEVPHKIKRVQSAKHAKITPPLPSSDTSKNSYKEKTARRTKETKPKEKDTRKNEDDQTANTNHTREEREDQYARKRKTRSANENLRKSQDQYRKKRNYDRQSGSVKTGVKPIEKRDGFGSYNWGTAEDVVDEINKPKDEFPGWGDAPKEEPPFLEPEAADGAEANEPEEGADGQTEHLEAKEPERLTLDEWKSRREAGRASRAKPQFNIRRAGEGEDPNKWEAMYELKKKEGSNEDPDEEYYDAGEYPQRVGRQKRVLDIEIHFNDERRGGIGTGRGRPSGRGRVRMERKPRNDETLKSQQEKVPQVYDERDFPSLK